MGDKIQKHHGIRNPTMNSCSSKCIRALCLLSCGVDSRPAVCILKRLGVDAHGVVFESPFFNSAFAMRAADELNIPIHTINFSKDIISLLDNPKHGFGSCMNPCIDCQALMLKRAGELMEELGFHFISAGETLNEQSISRNRRGLALVAAESGYADLIVRPLCARLLPETKPEKLGWIDRSKLFAIHGRGCKTQLHLAEHFGLARVTPVPGDCRLKEPNFCKRLNDLKKHEGLNGERSVMLLRFGRHFRLADNLKIIVGRNEKDNAVLEGNAELYDLILKMDGVRGPTGLLPLTATDEQIRLGAALCARYSDLPPGTSATVKVRSSRGVKRIQVQPAECAETDLLRI